MLFFEKNGIKRKTQVEWKMEVEKTYFIKVW